MLTEFLSPKILSLSDTSGRLQATLVRGSDSNTWCCDLIPTDLTGGTLALVKWLAGEQVASHLDAVLGSGGQVLDPIIQIEGSKIEVVGLASLEIERFRLSIEKQTSSSATDTQQGVPADKLPSDQVFTLAFSGTLALEGVASLSGDLVLQIKSGAPPAMQFQLDNDSQLPAINIPLPGIGPDLVLTPSVSALDLAREKNTGSTTNALVSEGRIGISGGPEWLDNLLPDELAFNFSIASTKNLSGQSKLLVSLTIPELMDDVTVDLPAIPNIIDIPGLTNVSLGSVNLLLSNLSVVMDGSNGFKPYLTLDCGVGLPAGLNRLAGTGGQDDPILGWANTFDPAHPDETRVIGRLVVDEELVQFKLLTSPVKGIQTTQQSNVPGSQQGSTWIIDLGGKNPGDNGLIHIEPPIFAKSTSSDAMAASGGFEIKRPLNLSLDPIKSLFDGLLFSSASSVLPDSIELKDINILNGNKLNTSALAELWGSTLPPALNAVFSQLSFLIEHMPDQLKSYLNFTIPDSFYYNFRMNADGSCVGGVKLPDNQPLRILLPAGMGLLGIELRQASLGQLNGGKLGLLELDVVVDHFFLPEVVASMALNLAKAPLLPGSNNLYTRLELREVMAIINFQSTTIVPLFYNKIAIGRLGAEGFDLASEFSLPKPTADILDIIKLASMLVDFLTLPASDKRGLLNPASTPQVLSTAFVIGEQFIKTPAYTGEALLGKENEPVLIVGSNDLWPYLAHSLNFLKTGHIDELLQAFPLEYRVGSQSLNFFGLANIAVDWLISSPEEFRDTAYPHLGLSNSESDQVLALLPDMERADPNRIVTLLRGEADIAGVANFDSTFAFSGGLTGATTGFRFNGELADLVGLELLGKVALETGPATFEVAGTSRLTLLDVTVLEGQVGIKNDSLYLSGELDLFPDSNVLSLRAEVAGEISSSGVMIQGETDFQVGGVSVIEGEIRLTHQLLKIDGQCLGIETRLLIGSRNGKMAISGTLGFSRRLSIKTGDIFIQGIKVSDAVELELECDIALNVSVIGTSFNLGVKADFNAFERALSVEFNLTTMPGSIEDLIKQLPAKIVVVVEDALASQLNRPEKLLQAIMKMTLAVTDTSVNAISIENGKNDVGLLNLNNRFVNITALATYDGEPGLDNLFAYAQYNQPSFRLPSFKVDSVALALACNRTVKLPDLGQVERFPLVKQLNHSSSIGASVSTSDVRVAKAAVRNLLSVLPYKRDTFTLAAGIKANSFSLMHSTNVFMLETGNKNTASLVGRSHLQLPPKPLSTLVNLEFDYRVNLDIAAGNMKVGGKLSRNSYLFSSVVKLSGDFAYYAWSSGKHAGDFVVTIGGYAPKYRRPSHYPNIPRVGFDWDLAEFITAEGKMYMALTPKELMTGGRLELAFVIKGNSTNELIKIADLSLGKDIKVKGISNLVDTLPESIKNMTQTTEMFEASAITTLDIVMSWYPMAYRSTMTFEMQASLKLKQIGSAVFEVIEKVWEVVDEIPILREVKGLFDWFIEKVGVKKVYGWVKKVVEDTGNFIAHKFLNPSISVEMTIWGPNFGGNAELDCHLFSFKLPLGGSSAPRLDEKMSWNTFFYRYLANIKPELVVTKGALGVKTHAGKRWYIVDPDEAELVCHTQSPASEITLTSNGEQAWCMSGGNFHLAPMGAQKTDDWDLAIAYDGPGGMYFQGKPVYQHYPAAVWGSKFKPSDADAPTLSLLSGTHLIPRSGKPPGFTETVDADEFKYQDVVENDPTWQWGSALKNQYSDDFANNEQRIRDSIEDEYVATRRTRLAEFIGLDQPISLAGVASNPQSAFIGIPRSAIH